MRRLLERISSSKKRNRPATYRPTLESLEARRLFVVGAFDVPDAVLPGEGYDGVVQLNTCTGSLLSTGRHILTAAHCVDDGVTSDTARFEMNGKTISIDSSQISIHPGWTGDVRRGNDIAVITLESLAPSGVGGDAAERYEIYTDGNEEGQVFTMVGYGLTGTGGAGSTPGSNGTKRLGQNRWDKDATALMNEPIKLSGLNISQGEVLAYDFDKGGWSTDVFGRAYNVHDTGLGDAEAMQSQGDSGGPAFIDGKISGVVSGSRMGWSVTDIDSTFNNSFGEFAVMTRAGHFNSWINQQMAGDYEFVLDMTKQMDGDDGSLDQLVAKRNGNNLEVWVNGTLIHSEAVGNLTGVTIIGSSDGDRLTIEGDLGIEVFFDGAGGTNDRLTVKGTNNNDRFDVWSDKIELNYRDHTFANIEVLKAYGYDGNDNFYVRTMPSVSTYLYGNNDNDTLTMYTGAEPTHNFRFYGHSGNDVAKGASTPNAWEITGANFGYLNGVRLSSVENFDGGNSIDVFEFTTWGSVAGEIDGRGGADTLDYSSLTSSVSVDLYNGSATKTGSVRGIENVKGTSADDILLGSNSANTFEGMGGNDILVGRGGNDTLIVTSGRNLLIGGDGSDTIDGGGGEDLLIGGMTAYDFNLTALNTIMSTWESTSSSHYSRRLQLKNGVGAGRGSVQLSNSTVYNDRDNDIIEGDGSRDWFWADYGDSTDRVNGYEYLK